MSNTPSDADIENLAAEHLKAFSQFPMGGQVWFEGEVEFARAVLAKWGAQPVAREQLTDEQLVEAFCTTPGLNPRQMVGCFVAGARFAERHNGITQKGGQHGADT